MSLDIEHDSNLIYNFLLMSCLFQKQFLMQTKVKFDCKMRNNFDEVPLY